VKKLWDFLIENITTIVGLLGLCLTGSLFVHPFVGILIVLATFAHGWYAHMLVANRRKNAATLAELQALTADLNRQDPQQ